MDTNFNKISIIITNSIEKENDLSNDDKLKILVLVKKIAKDKMDLEEKVKELTLCMEIGKYDLFVQSNEKKKDKLDLLTTKLESCIIMDDRKKKIILVYGLMNALRQIPMIPFHSKIYVVIIKIG